MIFYGCINFSKVDKSPLNTTLIFSPIMSHDHEQKFNLSSYRIDTTMSLYMVMKNKYIGNF